MSTFPTGNVIALSLIVAAYGGEGDEVKANSGHPFQRIIQWEHEEFNSPQMCNPTGALMKLSDNRWDEMTNEDVEYCHQLASRTVLEELSEGE